MPYFVTLRGIWERDRRMPKRLRTREHTALRHVLIAAREEKKVTQEELARRLKRPRSYISRVETGEGQLNLIQFKRWMQALKQDDVAMYTRWSQWNDAV